MSHIQQSPCSISLDTHVIRSCHASKRYESAGLGDLGLVLIVCGQVGYAPDSIALHFDVRAQHLTDQRLQSAKSDDQ